MCIIIHTMKTTRMNITLPNEVAAELKKAPNRSAFIATSLIEKFERDKKTRLERVLAKAYADANKEDKEVARDWDSTVGDGIE